jgi:hypothetical protein
MRLREKREGGVCTSIAQHHSCDVHPFCKSVALVTGDFHHTAELVSQLQIIVLRSLALCGHIFLPVLIVILIVILIRGGIIRLAIVLLRSLALCGHISESCGGAPVNPPLTGPAAGIVAPRRLRFPQVWFFSGAFFRKYSTSTSHFEPPGKGRHSRLRPNSAVCPLPNTIHGSPSSAGGGLSCIRCLYCSCESAFDSSSRKSYLTSLFGSRASSLQAGNVARWLQNACSSAVL